MARLGIDGTAISPEGKGISRVQRGAIAALAALETGHELVAYVRSGEAARLLAPLRICCVVIGHRRAIAWEQRGLARAVNEHGLDAFLTTTERLPILGRGRFLVWLFEIPTHRIEQNRLHRAGAYQRGSDLLTLALWKRSLRRAAVVLAGSAATAAEVEREIPELAGSVRVVHPGLDPGFGPGASERGDRYVLHLASSDPRDDTETALEAFRLALNRLDEPVRLLLAGNLGARRLAIEAEIERLGLAGTVELLGRVSDQELVALYRGASAYLDPTLFEGFGYQVLEAMACGVPVVASRSSSIPEIVEDAGVLCEPRSPAAFAEALVRVLRDTRLADQFRSRATARAAAFTWERTARSLTETVEAVLAAPADAR